MWHQEALSTTLPSASSGSASSAAHTQQGFNKPMLDRENSSLSGSFQSSGYISKMSLVFLKIIDNTFLAKRVAPKASLSLLNFPLTDKDGLNTELTAHGCL